MPLRFMTSLENEPQLAIQFNPDMDKDAKHQPKIIDLYFYDSVFCILINGYILVFLNKTFKSKSHLLHLNYPKNLLHLSTKSRATNAVFS